MWELFCVVWGHFLMDQLWQLEHGEVRIQIPAYPTGSVQKGLREFWCSAWKFTLLTWKIPKLTPVLEPHSTCGMHQGFIHRGLYLTGGQLLHLSYKYNWSQARKHLESYRASFAYTVSEILLNIWKAFVNWAYLIFKYCSCWQCRFKS